MMSFDKKSSGSFVFKVSFYLTFAVIRRWRDAEAMSMLRSRVGVAVMKSRLYAIGGYNGTERLNTVEEFDAGSWVTNTRGVPFPQFL